MWASQTGTDNWPNIPKVWLSLKEKQDLFEKIQAERFVDLVGMYNELGKA